MQTITPVLTLCELPDAGFPGVPSWSPFCLKVHRALGYLGLPYARRHGSRPSDFRAINPAAQVPVLLVGDEPVHDSTRILARLDQLTDGALGGGLDAAARAESRLWEELADTSVNGFLVAARWADDDNWTRTKAAYFASMPALVRAIVPGRLRANVVRGLVARDVLRGGADACWARFELLLDDLEVRAPEGGTFWVGPSPSFADFGLFGQLHAFRTPLTPRQAEMVAARRRLSRWLDVVARVTNTQKSPRIEIPPGPITMERAPVALGGGSGGLSRSDAIMAPAPPTTPNQPRVL